jgi:Leucine-rich repeat (LRR) protein
MLHHDPVSGKKKGDANTTTAVDADNEPEYSSVSLRFNNNALENLDDIDSALSAVFDEPSKLQWLDLSGNHLSSIKAKTFLKYPNLFTLHLHGNNLNKYSDIDHLATCVPKLHALTLHGNLIEEKKHYRNYVIASFPNLTNLDFSPVTKSDREKAETWNKIYKNLRENSQQKIFSKTKGETL